MYTCHAFTPYFAAYICTYIFTLTTVNIDLYVCIYYNFLLFMQKGITHQNQQNKISTT